MEHRTFRSGEIEMTMRRILPVSAALFASVLVAAQADAPKASIANREIRAELYLPDAATGYYQGTRFDWAGAIASLTWNGHSYFGKWFDRYDPKTHDAITGPVEEFQSVGYDEAKVGEPFVRIGVGAVRKPQEAGYGQFKTYEIVDPGTRALVRHDDAIEFTHTLTGVGGYGYTYRKIVRLTGHTLAIEHHLTNTGRKPIVTNVYEHNFYMLDNQPTGPDMVIRFPFEVTAAADLKGLAEARGREVVYLRELQGQESIYSELKGYGASAKDYDIRVENRKTGAAVRQTSDRPLAKLVVWSPRSTVCPEAYIDLNVAPGQETGWTIRWEMYEVGVSR
jgi:hypothetical protein